MSQNKPATRPPAPIAAGRAEAQAQARNAITLAAGAVANPINSSAYFYCLARERSCDAAARDTSAAAGGCLLSQSLICSCAELSTRPPKTARGDKAAQPRARGDWRGDGRTAARTNASAIARGAPGSLPVYIYIAIWNRMQAKEGRRTELETQTNQQGSNFLTKIGECDWSVPGISLGARRTNR